ncbi:MAG: Flp family type IVb pilin [Roseibium sp.]
MFSGAYSFAKALCSEFLQDCRGAASVEYGLLVALISVAGLFTILSIGETLRDDVFGTIANSLSSASPPSE